MKSKLNFLGVILLLALILGAIYIIYTNKSAKNNQNKVVEEIKAKVPSYFLSGQQNLVLSSESAKSDVFITREESVGQGISYDVQKALKPAFADISAEMTKNGWIATAGSKTSETKIQA